MPLINIVFRLQYNLLCYAIRIFYKTTAAFVGRRINRRMGYRFLIIGLAMIALQLVPYLFLGTNILNSLGDIIESLYFLVSMLAATAGIYLTLGSYLNRPPHTSVLISVPGAKDILAIFQGWDSKDARDFVTKYRRAKRGI